MINNRAGLIVSFVFAALEISIRLEHSLIGASEHGLIGEMSNIWGRV
jgi:hypothetical protein